MADWRPFCFLQHYSLIIADMLDAGFVAIRQHCLFGLLYERIQAIVYYIIFVVETTRMSTGFDTP